MHGMMRDVGAPHHGPDPRHAVGGEAGGRLRQGKCVFEALFAIRHIQAYHGAGAVAVTVADCPATDTDPEMPALLNTNCARPGANAGSSTTARPTISFGLGCVAARAAAAAVAWASRRSPHAWDADRSDANASSK